MLTDGAISDTDDLINTVQRSPHLRQIVLSAIGIGSGASSELVTRLAQAGGGMADMIQNEKIIPATVIKQLKISRAHRLQQFQLLWNNMVFPLAKNSPAVFEGE